MERMALIAIGAGLIFLLCATRWRESAMALIYLVFFEGALRKWALPSFSSELYMLKDVVLVAALCGWLAKGTPVFTINTRRYFAMVGVFTLFGTLQIVNPAMASPVGGIFGLKAYVLWAAYPALLIAALRTREKFESYLKQLLIVAVPICLLAVVQSRLPTDSFLNVYARERTQIDTFGSEGAVRVTGPFPFLAGYANFLIFISVFLLPLTLHSRNPANKLLSYTLFPLVVGTAFMTGARWPVFFLGLFLFGYLSTIVCVGMKSRVALKSMMIPVVVSVLALLILFQSSLAGWLERVEGASGSGDTFLGRTLLQFVYAFDAGVFTLMGDGIGSTNNAAQAITDLLHMPLVPSQRSVEAEPGRVMAELGVLGFLLWYALRVFLIVQIFAIVPRLRDPLLKSLAIAGGWFMTIGILAPVPFDTTLGAFYWLVAGFSFILPQLDQKSPARSPVPRRRIGSRVVVPLERRSLHSL